MPTVSETEGEPKVFVSVTQKALDAPGDKAYNKDVSTGKP